MLGQVYLLGRLVDTFNIRSKIQRPHVFYLLELSPQTCWPVGLQELQVCKEGTALCSFRKLSDHCMLIYSHRMMSDESGGSLLQTFISGIPTTSAYAFTFPRNFLFLMQHTIGIQHGGVARSRRTVRHQLGLVGA